MKEGCGKGQRPERAVQSRKRRSFLPLFLVPLALFLCIRSF